MNQLIIKRAGRPQNVVVDINERTTFNRVVMGEHVINANFISKTPLDIDEGDYIEYNGERFTINRPLPPVEKSSSYEYAYNITFEGYVYDLLDQVLSDEGAIEFSYFGKPLAFLQLIVDSMNQISSGWAVGEVDDAPEQTISFIQDGQGYTCKGALIRVAETFSLEYFLTGKTINLKKQAGVDTNLTFEYGRTRGLYSISRGELPSDQPYFNRIIGFGGRQNIPSGYRGGSKRLRLAEDYLEKEIPAGKRRKAGSVLFDDIFPERTGTVTAVSADWLEITDTTLFDINGNKIDGVDAEISFVSGESTGIAFKILDYNHTTKTIYIDKRTEEDGYIRPNATFSIAVGDKYKLLGISLPAEYVTDAENRLRARMLETLDKAFNNIPPYSVVVDPKYLRDNGVSVSAGDRVRIKDAGLAVDKMIRVTGVSFPLVSPNEASYVISDYTSYGDIGRVIKGVDETKKDVAVIDRQQQERARQNTISLNKLSGRIFNPDGSLYDGELSLKAGMLKVGFDSGDFTTTIARVKDPDVNKLVLSSGQLAHRLLSVEGLGDVWSVAGNTFEALDPAKFYYVYARCSTASLTGVIEISEDQIQFNAFSGSYMFLLGQLFEINAEGYRDFVFTKGVTFVVGDQIYTGRVQDRSGMNYLDLDTGSFNLGSGDKGIDFDVTNPDTLTIRGALASDVIQVGSEGVVNAGISGLTDTGTTSTRFWAGDDADNKDTADFRVQDNGQVFATRVKLGYGEADGTSTGWDVTPSGIISDPKPGETENFALIRGTSYNKEFSLGTELIPATSGDQVSMVGRIQNNRPHTDEVFPTTNTALQLKASGANKNYALDINQGGIKLPGNKEGLTVTRGIKIQDAGTSDIERVYEAEFVNGILVRLTYLG